MFASILLGADLTCAERREGGTAVARYLFKDMTTKKAELPPLDFRGKLFVASRQFCTKPNAKLKREVKGEWRARTRQ